MFQGMGGRLALGFFVLGASLFAAEKRSVNILFVGDMMLDRIPGKYIAAEKIRCRR